MKPFDPTKPIQTRDGRKARIICADANYYDIHGNKEPIMALIEVKNGIKGIEKHCSFSSNGQYFHDKQSEHDLVNIPEKKELDVWVNVYSNFSSAYCSRSEADRNSSPTRIACVHVTQEFTEGEGLSNT